VSSAQIALASLELMRLLTVELERRTQMSKAVRAVAGLTDIEFQHMVKSSQAGGPDLVALLKELRRAGEESA
jgi:hypothetical protein